MTLAVSLGVKFSIYKPFVEYSLKPNSDWNGDDVFMGLTIKLFLFLVGGNLRYTHTHSHKRDTSIQDVTGRRKLLVRLF